LNFDQLEQLFDILSETLRIITIDYGAVLNEKLPVSNEPEYSGAYKEFQKGVSERRFDP